MKLSTLAIFILLLLSSCVPVIDVDLGRIIDGEAPTVNLSTESNPDLDIDLLDIDILTALASGPLIDENLGSCITSDFQLNPQPFRVVGAPFRVVGAPFRVVGANGEIQTDYDTSIQPNYLSNYFQTELPNSIELANPSEDVAVIILDEFGESTFDLGQALFEVEDVLPEQLIAFEQEGVSSHGALVMNHMNGIMAGLGTHTAARVADDTLEWQHSETGAKLIFKAIATSDFNTDAVGSELDQAISELRAQGVSKIIVNMSFVILPCSIVKDFVLNKLVYPSLFDYFEFLIAANTEVIIEAQGVPDFLSGEVSIRVAELVVESFRPFDPEADPLRQTILANPDVLFVGAAGNFGRDVAAYPAVWDEVLAVSASDPTLKAEFSNTGSVMLAGAWFRLTNPLGLNGHDLPVANIIYAGTSFAAPGVSVFSALDLATQGRCGLLGNNPRLSLLDASDVPLEEAILEACL